MDSLGGTVFLNLKIQDRSEQIISEIEQESDPGVCPKFDQIAHAGGGWGKS